MLCLLDYTAHRVEDTYSLPDWLNLHGVSYFRWAPTDRAPFGITKLIISGGPFHTNEIRAENRADIASLHVPKLGVCLGCMLLVEQYGGKLIDAHQSPSPLYVTHSGVSILLGVDVNFHATCAHRQRIASLPNTLAPIAVGEENEVVGVVHCFADVFGFMFHPESPQSDADKILTNFITGNF